MNCEESKILIHKLLDEDIEVYEKENLLEHFEGCEGCRIYYMELKKLLSLSKNLYLSSEKSILRKKSRAIQKLGFYVLTFITGVVTVWALLTYGFSEKRKHSSTPSIVNKEKEVYILETDLIVDDRMP